MRTHLAAHDEFCVKPYFSRTACGLRARTVNVIDFDFDDPPTCETCAEIWLQQRVNWEAEYATCCGSEAA